MLAKEGSHLGFDLEMLRVKGTILQRCFITYITISIDLFFLEYALTYDSMLICLCLGFVISTDDGSKNIMYCTIS